MPEKEERRRTSAHATVALEAKRSSHNNIVLKIMSFTRAVLTNGVLEGMSEA